MFGYVLPAADALSPADKETFQAAYCGLCHTLGRRYGLAGRMILNYDFTFLAMLLEKTPWQSCRSRCVAHPFRRRTCRCGSGAMDTAADMSIVLAWWQLQDGIADHGFFAGLKYRAAALFLRRAYRRAQKRQPAFDAATRAQLRELAALEAERCPSLDRPADTFARLLQSAAAAEEDPIRRRVLEQLLYHLGRWIYLIDAADDLAKDTAAGSYNPLPLRYGLTGGVLDEGSRGALARTLDASVRAMAAAFELADFGSYQGVVRNVVYMGLYQVAGGVLSGSFHNKKQKN